MVIRAIFFDFYSVWLPNPFSQYLDTARQLHGPVVASEVEAVVGQYFQGEVDASYVAEFLRVKLNKPEVTEQQFLLQESAISPAVTDFMRNLHGHFVKLGVLANLGTQEYKLLSDFNAHNQLFEIIGGPLPFGMKVPLLSQEVFAKALQLIGEPPRSCLVITGDLTYQRFAEGLGIATLPFEGLPKLQQTLEQELANEVP